VDREQLRFWREAHALAASRVVAEARRLSPRERIAHLESLRGEAILADRDGRRADEVSQVRARFALLRARLGAR
jgi:hypothetical protein